MTFRGNVEAATVHADEARKSCRGNGQDSPPALDASTVCSPFLEAGMVSLGVFDNAE